MTKLEQPLAPGRFYYYPEDDVAPQYANVWRHAGASVDLLCHIIDIYGGLVGRYECEDMPGHWVRDTSEPPQEKPEPEWLDEPEATQQNEPWWFYDGEAVYVVTVFECLSDACFRMIGANGSSRCDSWADGKWLPWQDTKPEPPEPPVLLLLEEAKQGYAKDKETGEVFRVVEWTARHPSEIVFTVERSGCRDFHHYNLNRFVCRYTWLTEAEAKEHTP